MKEIPFSNDRHFVLLWNEMQSAPSTLYRQSIDKQRIVAVGQSNSRIIQMILFVLQQYKRKVDYSTPSGEKISDAAVLLIAPEINSSNIQEYNHHILIISQLSPTEKATCLKLADATPKGGTIIYDESDPLSREIGKIERAEISVSPFSGIRFEMKNGTLELISSTNERVATKLTSASDSININAAKELLKKIGISSGQFYRAIASFQ